MQGRGPLDHHRGPTDYNNLPIPRMFLLTSLTLKVSQRDADNKNPK